MEQSRCPCGSGREYAQCCEPYHLGKAHAPTPEALMRSRYSAYVKGQEKYLFDTLAPESRKDYDAKSAREWAEKAEWLGLQILSAEGTKVEFQAKYRMHGKTLEHHEVSKFKKQSDRWYFVDGDSHTHEEGQGHHHHHEALKPIVNEAPKVGRNDPCPCGSGQKFKKCCGK